MTDLRYEKQGSYLQAKEDDAKALLIEGDSVEKVVRVTKLPKEKVLKLQAELAKGQLCSSFLITSCKSL